MAGWDDPLFYEEMEDKFYDELEWKESFETKIAEYDNSVIEEYGKNHPTEPSFMTPQQLLSSISEFLTTNPKTYQRAINIKGIYTPGNGQAYRGFYYDYLKEETTNLRLTIYVPALIRTQLQPGNLVILSGSVVRNINTNSSIDICLGVDNIIKKVSDRTVSDEDLKRMDIVQRKSAKGLKDVDNILRQKLMRDEKPRLYFQFPPVNDTSADVQACIKTAPSNFDIVSNNNASFARTNLLCQQLRWADTQGYDAICLIRGGGSGLDVLDHVELLECLCNMRTPLIGAVGHAPDKKRYFVMNLFDKNVATPSALGQYLNDMVQTVTAERNDSIAVITEKIKKGFEDQINRLTEDKKRLEKAFNDSNEFMKKLSSEKDKALKEQLSAFSQVTELRRTQAEIIEKAVEEQVKKLSRTVSSYKLLTIILFAACCILGYLLYGYYSY